MPKKQGGVIRLVRGREISPKQEHKLAYFLRHEIGHAFTLPKTAQVGEMYKVTPLQFLREVAAWNWRVSRVPEDVDKEYIKVARVSLYKYWVHMSGRDQEKWERWLPRLAKKYPILYP